MAKEVALFEKVSGPVPRVRGAGRPGRDWLAFVAKCQHTLVSEKVTVDSHLKFPVRGFLAFAGFDGETQLSQVNSVVNAARKAAEKSPDGDRYVDFQVIGTLKTMVNGKPVYSPGPETRVYVGWGSLSENAARAEARKGKEAPAPVQQ